MKGEPLLAQGEDDQLDLRHVDVARFAGRFGRDADPARLGALLAGTGTAAGVAALFAALERGRSGIEVIVRMVILQLIPTLVEVTLMFGVLFWQFDWRYVLAIAIMVAAYMYYTYIATEWRIGIRRKMNDSDTEANTKAIDSLLNYETVKYFGAEEREAARYDRSMERYEDASVRTYTSLAVLNAGQAAIFTVGLT